MVDVGADYMSELIRGVVVATSRKLNGYCLVVLELSSKHFYRIVSDNKFRNDMELDDNELRLSDGNLVKNLDIINVCVKSKTTLNDDFQPENIVLDPSVKIKKEGQYTKNDLVNLFGGTNFFNFRESIFINHYGSMSVDEAKTCNSSFMIARVFSLKFYEATNSKNEKCCKCSFTYNHIEYKDISVTISPTKEIDIRNYAGKSYPNGIVGFSFGHPFEGRCFKYLCSFLGVIPYSKNRKGDNDGLSILHRLFE